VSRLLRCLLGCWICLGMQVVAAVPANLFQRVGFDQKLAANLPLDLPFRDSQGRWVHLNDYFGRRPVLLVLGYYQCPNLCDQVWRGLLESLQRLELDVGRDFELLAVSIDPQEGPELARSKRAAYLDAYVRPGTQAGWHFLTGEEKSIRHLADAVGFRYVYDPERDQYAHAAGLVVSTPDGHISRYLYGVRYASTDLHLALQESSAGRIGSVVDRLLLLCYQYDPANGRYGLLIMNLLRAAAAITLAALLGFVLLSRLRERRREARRETPS